MANIWLRLCKLFWKGETRLGVAKKHLHFHRFENGTGKNKNGNRYCKDEFLSISKVFSKSSEPAAGSYCNRKDNALTMINLYTAIRIPLVLLRFFVVVVAAFLFYA